MEFFQSDQNFENKKKRGSTSQPPESFRLGELQKVNKQQKQKKQKQNEMKEWMKNEFSYTNTGSLSL